MANKFLGLDSVNVLKDYIDKQILANNENTKVVTVHAYTYSLNDVTPEIPINGVFDPEAASIQYPAGWASLKNVLENIGDTAAIEEALSKGSIWMSVGVLEGNTKMTDTWSTPIKISGQNGVSVRFEYSYDDKAEESERSKYPKGPDSKNRTEWVWTKYGDDEWRGPVRWAVYSEDATNVVWRYCLSSDIEEGCPVNQTPWSLDLPLQAITAEYPYMWMSYKIIPARSINEIEDEPNTTTGWTSPVLFGHYGKDGKDGVDGNMPDYTLTLYSLGVGFTVPEKPILPETNTIDEFRNYNPSWIDIPNKEAIPVVYNIKGTEYVEVATEEDIINNISSPIKLTEDINLINALVISSDVTIDLNGHTITGGLFAESNGEMNEGNSDSYVFWVKDGGNLTIEGDGNVIAQEADYSMAVWCQGGTVTINGGNYYNGGDNCDLIYISKSGTVTINGGYFEATDKLVIPGGGTGYKRSALNIKNADIDKCTFIVNGGEFVDFDPSNLDKEVGGITSFVSPNCISSSKGNSFIVTVDPTTVDPDIWWHCSIKVNGQTNEIIEIGDVHRYNAVDGNAKPGQFTKYVFYWSNTQEIPNNLSDYDWKDIPSYDASNQEGSLWMKVTDVKIGATGQLEPLKPWSDPIKLTGPRGPIAYDYRMETRYQVGTATKAKNKPSDSVWSETPPSTNSIYPYIWAANYLVMYYMKYSADGKTVEIDNTKNFDVIKSYTPFRISGIDGKDGENGNTKNSVKYLQTQETIKIKNFVESNYFISNSTDDVNYDIDFDQLSFVTGYTGKFANIGTGNVTISSNKYKFLGSCKEDTVIILNPHETVELVCYKTEDTEGLLVIGKSL